MDARSHLGIKVDRPQNRRAFRWVDVQHAARSPAPAPPRARRVYRADTSRRPAERRWDRLRPSRRSRGTRCRMMRSALEISEILARLNTAAARLHRRVQLMEICG